MSYKESILKRLVELEKVIRDKKKLEIGDPDFREYYRILNIIESTSIRGLIEDARDLEEYYEEETRIKLAEVERERDNLQKRLENIAELLEPYLPKPDKKE